MTVVPGERRMVAVGMGDGMVRVVKLGINKVVAEMRHDEVEGVFGLGFEPGGRMVSGGGQVVKIWEESVEGDEEEGEEDTDGARLKKRKELDSEGSGSDREGAEGSSDEEEEEEEEEKGRKRRKKRKRRRGKERGGGPAHVVTFKGMD
ncbi:MAG: hypothetical protein Q9187_007363 [Circinaria calcarea]